MKVALVLRTLDIGGIEKSAVNLINECINRNFKIDLFLIEKKGALLKDVSPEVNVFQLARSKNPLCYSSAEAKKEGFLFYLKRTFGAVWCKLFSNKLHIKKMLDEISEINGYDAVISFQLTESNKSFSGGVSDIVLSKFNCKNKILFIHFDFMSTGSNNSYVFNQIDGFNKLVFVSKSCKDSFINNFPDLQSKCDYLYNFQDYNAIRAQAKIGERCESFDGINLLTVARLSPEKAHLRTLKVLSRLKCEGYKFKYHLVGDGPLNKEIKQYVKENDLSVNVVMHGNKSNPYGFIDSADTFLLFSYMEAAPMVIEECKCLGTAILATNTVSSLELIEDPKNVFENTENGIYLGLKQMFDARIIKKNKVAILTNDAKFEKFLKIIGE